MVCVSFDVCFICVAFVWFNEGLLHVYALSVETFEQNILRNDCFRMFQPAFHIEPKKEEHWMCWASDSFRWREIEWQIYIHIYIYFIRIVRDISARWARFVGGHVYVSAEGMLLVLEASFFLLGACLLLAFWRHDPLCVKVISGSIAVVSLLALLP